MLRFFQDQTYAPTSDDRLWLLRAVASEGPPHTRVAEALINGFALARSRGYDRSLGAYVRAYAQPINPRWFPGGDLYLHSLVGKSQVERDRLLAVAQKRIAHSTRTAFSDFARAAVDQALSARVTHDWTDYAAANVDGEARGLEPRTDPIVGENRFWTRAAGWTGYDGTGRASAPVGFGIAFVIGIVAWLLARGRV